MKTDRPAGQDKTNRPVKELRYRITVSFIVFAVILMALLWIFQSVFFDKYYELAMSRRCSAAVRTVADYYASENEKISYDSFVSFLGEKAEDNDIYIWMESTDGTFYISSESTGQGRPMMNSRELISQARRMLKRGENTTVSFTAKDRVPDDAARFVYAKYVESSSRNPVYIYAIASLAPLGPAVTILRSQLLIVTIVALIIGFFVARFTSKRLATPITSMEIKARELAKGNYDIHFEGGNYKELTDLAATLNQTAADLKASDALQKDLIANVSHDLRTPLTMIKSYAELIRDISGDDPVRRDEHLAVIIQETDRLDDLVGDILLLSKMQAGVLEMEMEDFDIQDAAESVFSTYLVMEQEGFALHFNRLPGTVAVHGDRRKIQQVISNLVSNAIRYSKDIKDVTLQFDRSAGSVTCAVIDKGIGIEAADLDKIWNRYQKASRQGTRSAQGTGLGLSIASEILEKHGAEYGVRSTPGEGSCFWFSLPVIEQPVS